MLNDLQRHPMLFSRWSKYYHSHVKRPDKRKDHPQVGCAIYDEASTAKAHSLFLVALLLATLDDIASQTARPAKAARLILLATNAAAPQIPSSGHLKLAMHRTAILSSIHLALAPKDPDSLAVHLRECLPMTDIFFTPESLLLLVVYPPTRLLATHSEVHTRLSKF